MRRVQAEDIPAFEELYDRHSATAFGLARLICGNSQRAEDALQDGFLAAWRGSGTYDPARGSAQTWLLTAVRHRSVDIMRRVRRNDSMHELVDQLEYLPASGSVAEDADRHDEADRLRASLQRLPVRQRQVIVLAYFGGLTHAEIAAWLQLPVGTVKGRMRLALQKVRGDQALALTRGGES